MKILVLGGTLFLGRVVVQAALERGHEVTLFNRGRTHPGLFPDAEHVIGDRNEDLSSLSGREFDAVVDTSAYFPRQVVAAVDALGGGIGHYTFISSGSVYADHSVAGTAESADVAVVDDPTEEALGENYGGFKALCEHALNGALPGRVNNVRAGLIVGPYDNTGRFSYWIERLSAGGEVLAPAPRDQPVQLIDVRDLAEWILLAAQAELAGTFNATGTPGTETMATMLKEIQRCTTTGSDLTWIDEEFLLNQGVEPWSDMPLWLPHRGLPGYAGFMSRDNSRALEHGLTLRPLRDTIEATQLWLAAAEPPMAAKDYGNLSPQAGLPAAREAELLAAWAQRARE